MATDAPAGDLVDMSLTVLPYNIPFFFQSISYLLLQWLLCSCRKAKSSKDSSGPDAATNQLCDLMRACTLCKVRGLTESFSFPGTRTTGITYGETETRKCSLSYLSPMADFLSPHSLLSSCLNKFTVGPTREQCRFERQKQPLPTIIPSFVPMRNMSTGSVGTLPNSSSPSVFLSIYEFSKDLQPPFSFTFYLDRYRYRYDIDIDTHTYVQFLFMFYFLRGALCLYFSNVGITGIFYHACPP